MSKRLKKLMRYQSFWPVVILLVILLFNGIASGGAFFQLKIVDGHLYGRLIDILRNGSKLMLLAIGMTMVLATGGTDISVGSVMAISGAIAWAEAWPRQCCSRCFPASCAACGTACWFPE